MRFHHVAVGLVLPLCVAGCARRGAMSPPPAGSAVAPRVADEPPKTEPRKTPPVPATPRRARVDSAKLETAMLLQRSHTPLTRVLARRSGNPHVADRAAAAVLSESRRLRLSASLVAAVMLVENTPLDTTALSVAGAIGLMQVMPVHSGALGCASAELREVEANICHGTRVLKMYLQRNRTVNAALRRYNGCVGALTTRRCLRYPGRVLRLASGIRRELLATPHPVTSPTPPQTPYYLRHPAAVPDSLALSDRVPRQGLLSLPALLSPLLPLQPTGEVGALAGMPGRSER